MSDLLTQDIDRTSERLSRLRVDDSGSLSPSETTYRDVVFDANHHLGTLVDAVGHLVTILQGNTLYAQAVCSIAVHGWRQGPTDEEYHGYLAALDTNLAHLLGLVHGLTSLLLDVAQTGFYQPLPKTLTQALSMDCLRCMVMDHILVPAYSTTENALLSPSAYGYPSASLERIALDIRGGDWLQLLFDNPSRVRWVGLHASDDCRPRESSWSRAMYRIAATATRVETLVLSGGQNIDIETLGYIMKHGFQCGALSAMRAFSVDTLLGPPAVHHLFFGFAQSQVTHLRLVVNHFNQWAPGFSSAYIDLLASLLPHLEEVILDQIGMTEVSQLPGNLHDWALAFRQIPNLRRIGLASLFVLDVHGPCQACPESDSGSDSDSNDSESEHEEDVLLDEKILPPESPMSPIPPPLSCLDHNLCVLAAWTETFLDEHLQCPTLAEFWLLGVRAPATSRFAVSGGGVGYRQHLSTGDVKFMVYQTTRDGWWWERLRPVEAD
ncbi:hypothetical protein BV25DRAFT_1915249 [Artomyces pyxidatus]|uniref:Uncharacterized protein n=1 Tax=Artomyces pyxidatus TaxID=48021 RepID=A0ACB8T5D4_9AGAM|nr:hypothetical protein BV25DRAFT_1915249 [Artomyces pyxidatus]